MFQRGARQSSGNYPFTKSPAAGVETPKREKPGKTFLRTEEMGKGRGKRTRRSDRAALLRAGSGQAEGVVSWVVERAEMDVRALTGQRGVGARVFGPQGQKARRDLRLDLDQLTATGRQEAKTLAEYLVHMAKAEALLMIGEDEQAYALVEGHG